MRISGFFRRAAGVSAVLLAACAPVQKRPPGVDEVAIEEASIADLQSALAQGRITSRELIARHLARIAAHESLHVVLHVNPQAIREAGRRDAERRDGHVRGPLHGIPIALKDTIQTADMPTTGGALALAGFVPREDATLVLRLRDAGAILIAKTNLTELSHAVSWSMPVGYSALGGQGVNPYGAALSPGGSSSGAGVAASLWPAAVGTETDGSILAPAIANLLVGIRPTRGRVSGQGLIPWMRERDIAGPMARSVDDAALLLSAIEDDSAGNACPPLSTQASDGSADVAGLHGLRIGVVQRSDGVTDAARHLDTATALRAAGATIVDPALMSTESLDVRPCATAAQLRDPGSDCSIVYHYALKRDFGEWLASSEGAPVDSLGALRRWNRAHADHGALRFGQAFLDEADSIDLERDRARFEREYARQHETVKAAVDGALQTQRLDALLFAGHEGSTLAAVPGYPAITIPLGLAGEPRAPAGAMLLGAACSEPVLIRIARELGRSIRGRHPPP